MKIFYIDLSNYSSPDGSVSFRDEMNTVRSSLTESEAREILALAEEIVLRRTASIAASIAAITPLALAAPCNAIVEHDDAF